MSSSPVRGPVLRDLSPNCRLTKDGGGWLGDSDSIIIALSEDEVVPSENVSLAPSLEAEIMRSTSCVPHPGTPSLPHPRSSPQAASPSVASMTPTRQRIMSSNASAYSRTPTSTPRLKTLAPIPTLRRVSTTPTAIKSSRPTATTPTSNSIATHQDIQARHSQWEQRRAEERRRREEETSVLEMLASVDRGNEEHKLARQSLKKVEESSSQNPPHPATPLFESPSDLGGASSVVYQRPSALAAAQTSPAPMKPREGTLSPQDRRDKEAHYRNIKSSDAEDADGDNDKASPINDGSHPPAVDACAETLKGASSAPNDNIKQEDQVVTPTRASYRTPRSLPPLHTVSPAALTPSHHREDTRGPLVSPQRPTRSLTPSECMVAKAVSRSLSQQQAFNNSNHGNSSPSATTSMKGCSITVSPLSSKAVSPIPATTTTTTTTTAAVEVPAPIKVEVDVPTTPQTYVAKPACSSVASGTPLLSVSTATQMTPQLVVVPSVNTTSNNEAEDDDDDWEVPSSQVTTTTTLVKKEPSEEVQGERDVVEKENKEEEEESSAKCSSSSHAVVPDNQDDPSSVKKEKVLLPLGGAAAIGQKRSRDTSSQTSNLDNRSHSRATTAHSSRVASEPQEEEEKLIQPEPKIQSEKLLRIAAKKKAILSQSPVPRANEQQPISRPERELTRKERKRQIDQEHRERLRMEREAQERRAKASSRNSGQKKKKNIKKK